MMADSPLFSATITTSCHGPCSVMFFLKNNKRMAPKESPMMANPPLFSATNTTSCHGPCSVMFFLKNNQRTAPTEPPMMAASPLFSATFTTDHPCRTYIGAPLEYFLHSDTTNKSAFLSLSLPTSTMCYLPQHNQSPTMLHTHFMFQANHIVHAPVLEVMGLSHHKDL